MSKTKKTKTADTTHVTEGFVTLRKGEESEADMRARKLEENRTAENARVLAGEGLPSSLI